MSEQSFTKNPLHGNMATYPNPHAHGATEYGGSTTVVVHASGSSKKGGCCHCSCLTATILVLYVARRLADFSVA
jgi:hypothetical protein